MTIFTISGTIEPHKYDPKKPYHSFPKDAPTLTSTLPPGDTSVISVQTVNKKVAKSLESVFANVFDEVTVTESAQ